MATKKKAAKKKAAKKRPATKTIKVKVSKNCSLAGAKLKLTRSGTLGTYLGTVCKEQASKRKSAKKKTARK